MDAMKCVAKTKACEDADDKEDDKKDELCEPSGDRIPPGLPQGPANPQHGAWLVLPLVGRLGEACSLWRCCGRPLLLVHSGTSSLSSGGPFPQGKAPYVTRHAGPKGELLYQNGLCKGGGHP